MMRVHNDWVYIILYIYYHANIIILPLAIFIQQTVHETTTFSVASASSLTQVDPTSRYKQTSVLPAPISNHSLADQEIYSFIPTVKLHSKFVVKDTCLLFRNPSSFGQCLLAVYICWINANPSVIKNNSDKCSNYSISYSLEPHLKLILYTGRCKQYTVYQTWEDQSSELGMHNH